MAEVHARGLSFHVQYLGEGPPRVVFLHGLIMDNLSSWYFSVANAVAEATGVLLYDLRGHGYSQRTPEGYGLDDAVLDLAAVLDGAGVAAPVHLVGNSFGGLLSLAFAHRFPDRVHSLVLVDGLVPEPGWGRAMTATLGLRGEQTDAVIAENFKNWLGRHSDRKRNKLVHQARGLVEGTALLADVEASPGLSAEELSAIRCPVLALYGSASDQRLAGEGLCAVLPNARLELFDGCTHSILWEATDRVRARVRAWVEERS